MNDDNIEICPVCEGRGDGDGNSCPHDGCDLGTVERGGTEAYYSDVLKNEIVEPLSTNQRILKRILTKALTNQRPDGL